VTVLDLSKYLGLIALYLLTANILLGLLTSVRYDTINRWPHRDFNLLNWHNRTGYVAAAVALCHPTMILFSSSAHFRILDLVVPLWSPSQPVANTIGALALYAVAFVLVTSYFRRSIGRKLWRRFHYLAYAAAALVFTHGLLTDPQLKHRRVNPLNGEKVSVEVCIVLVAAGAGMRVRHTIAKRSSRSVVTSRDTT
jgi:predicted ferric reductase